MTFQHDHDMRFVSSGAYYVLKKMAGLFNIILHARVAANEKFMFLQRLYYIVQASSEKHHFCLHFVFTFNSGKRFNFPLIRC